MPELVRLYIRNVLIGIGLAVAFVAALLGFNVANLRHLILGSDMGWIAVAMLVVFNAVVFSGVQFAIAVMRMAEPEDRGNGGLRVRVSDEPAPVRAAAPARSKRRRAAWGDRA